MKALSSILWTVVFVLLFAGLSFAEAVVAGTTGGTLGDTLLAGGWGGGLWKGLVIGALRALVGYWSKKPEDNEVWDWSKLLAGIIVGGGAGALTGCTGMSYETVGAWAAQFGITEVVYRAIQGLWRRLGSKVAAEVVVKAMAIREQRTLVAKAPPHP
jgi:hypothetical protein